MCHTVSSKTGYRLQELDPTRKVRPAITFYSFFQPSNGQKTEEE